MKSTEMTIFDAGAANSANEAEIKELRDENKKLARALADANVRAERAEEDAARALTALRRQLTPLYRALQAVFGELDAAGVGDEPQASVPSSAGAPNARVSAVWASWKEKMGAAGKVIDALLLHKELNTQQLAIACGIDRTTVPNYIHKLTKAGLINKNGGRFSLKQL